ncbi:carbohydrate ABC transporter permease [Pseudomonas ficuserectae]|uniref:carbohydrate ABC transporter permease n=1 Tax=Pseudomonas ficuserectae TaxID=53410 RepID=UPI0006D5D446|nr:sugar ABC transporter permease [Pseudomonas ficuserectae]KPX47454.1 Binding-protein dependent transport system inner membrane protein [Pseudomonas ficuserectae]RMS30434.1 Binding-protein dependent transport system inner membrane protein [Pseudomonas ficuserectae]RMS40985.1 Binding-protein dependent transport system inner membrane protein [Pseudomonas ficuserectae]
MNTSASPERTDLSGEQQPLKSRRFKPGWFLVSPSVALLLVWMIVPLGMTIYFSLIRYNLLSPGENEFVGLENFQYFVTDSGFLPGAGNTLLLVGSVLAISVILGVLISALLEASEFFGRGIVRVLLISPFFIMPTVSALIWKNLIFHPVSGVLAAVWKFFGAQPIDWFAHYPMLSIIIVSWQWLPFAILILMTAMQSLDQEQKEAARLDGAGPIAIFWHLTLPHLARPIAVVVMIETIFLLSVFAEIFTTTNGGPGFASTNLAYLIYIQALLQFDVGMASAGGLIAVVIANIAAIILIRMIGKNLTDKS